MNSTEDLVKKEKRSIIIWLVSIIAIIFGLVTIKSSGSVIFIDGSFRAEQGNFVPFIVWFNFSMGFVYIVTGFSIWKEERNGVWLSFFIIVATILAFAIFGTHILQGGEYEIKTVYAMTARISIWTVLASLSYWKIIRTLKK